MNNYDKTKERENLISSVIEQVRKNGNRPLQTATYGDVMWFVRTFMIPDEELPFDRNISSYGLKHICEDVIGKLCYNGQGYAYTSNDQIKQVLDSIGFVHCKEAPFSPNDIYRFRWAEGALDIIEAITQRIIIR